jgi:ribosomal protein S18 acetylase RimI-like enzyme
MQIDLHRVADLSAVETGALQELSRAVYPPEAAANWPGRGIEWAPAAWCVVCREDDGRALSYVGLIVREGRLNDSPAKIGGIGGVKTHPDARRQGLASQCLRRAIEFFDEQAVDFALLVCESSLVGLYEKLGWRLYPGALFVNQHDRKERFTFNLPMVHPVCSSSPVAGVIDLAGPPW